MRVYNGSQTQLPRHYVARQRLCLRATTDYWVSAMDGQPFFVVNPDYRHLDGQVRSATGKLTRRLANFAALTFDEPIDPEHVLQPIGRSRNSARSSMRRKRFFRARICA